MTEPGLLVVTPLRWEARAVGRGLPPDTVLRTGMGVARSRRSVGRIRARAPQALAVAGFCGALTDDAEPGDVVVATEVRSGARTIPCPSAPLLASALRATGLTVRLGPIATTDHVVHGPERAALAATGAVVADMESAVLAEAADGGPLAVVRVVVDTPSRPLVHPDTVRTGIRATKALGRIGPALVAWAAAAGDRTVLLAAPRSFCAGVERAIDVVERLLDTRPKPIYVRKQIVHNAIVVADLERRGAVFVDELDEVPEGATVVFSAHGVAPAVRQEAARRELDVVDATCPLVGKVHHEANRFAELGNTIVFIGHAGHEETEGTLGEAPDHMVLVENESEVDSTACAGSGQGELSDADHARGRRGRGCRDGTAQEVPQPQRSPLRRHLLRHHEPPARGPDRGG